MTFLFTDIEGSTRNWELHPGDMAAALSTHNALLRRAIADNTGVVFETAGDSFVAVFERPGDGLRAALDAQSALLATAWSDSIGTINVRMALDTGRAALRPDGYAAQHTLSRLSRILSAGHGGQILTSAATHEGLAGLLPPGVELATLGEHHLRDLLAPQEIFQVRAHGPPWLLPVDFPALRTLRWNNLPAPLTPLIGRRDVVDAVVTLLHGDPRLVTLTGAGGSGKTRVALQAASELAVDFDHGVAFVNLAPVRDADLVVSTVAMVLGVREQPGVRIADTLTEAIGDRRVLLVLDNFEQVAAASVHVAELVGGAAKLKVLTTSRIPLGISGEREYPVPPLDLPDREHLPSVGQLAYFDAVRLFVERAAAIKPGFALTDDNAAAVTEICVRLDGLPLAIELAAARIRLLRPQAIAARLENRLGLLTGGTSDTLGRQRTLRGTLDWSFELLTAAEQQLFRRLAVFTGGRTLEAAEAVCGVARDVDVLAGIESLVRNNLLKQNEQGGDEPRFMMLETIHEFALEKLVASGELHELRARHARYFVELAEALDHEPSGQATETEEFERLQVEHDNLRSAIEWTLAGAEQGDVERTDVAARLVSALARFWFFRGHWEEGSNWAAAVVANVQTNDVAVRAGVLFGAGRLAVERGDYETGRRLFEESVPLLRQAGDPVRAARALGRVGDALYAMGDYATARRLLEGTIDEVRGLGNLLSVAQASSSLAELSRAQGDYREARRLNESALATLRDCGHYGSSSDVVVRRNLGFSMLRDGEVDAAATALMTSLSMANQLRSAGDIALSMVGVAGVAVVRGEPERAVRLFGAADHIMERLGAHLWPADRLDYDHYLALVRGQLDEETFERARSEGRALSTQQAVAYAVSEER